MLRRCAVVVSLWSTLALLASARADTPTTQPARSDPPAAQPAVTDKFPTPADLLKALKAANKAAALPGNTASVSPEVAYFNLDEPLAEKPADFSFFADQQSLTLHTVLQRLDQAAHDKDVKAVLITVSEGQLNISQALELRDELRAVTKLGKRTFVYADSYDTDTYVVACGASDICMLGGGEIELPGVGIEVMFAKGLLDKVGVEADYEQIGEYKGADEEYTRTGPSPELTGQLNKLVDSLYNQVVQQISDSRHLSTDQVKKLIDGVVVDGDQAKAAGLVDHLVDVDGLRDLISDQLGTGPIDLVHDYGSPARQNVDFSSPFALFSLLARHPSESDRQAIGLIYAEGVITDGVAQDSLFGGSSGIGSEDMRRAIRLAERDPKIGAVVIRIDSPGGSALASEAMWQSVRRLSKTKPVIISVGSMAASGGYYLASSGDYIYADPTAIVGSIGVVGGKFVLKDLFDKIGLSTAVFSRGANANLFGSDDPWTPQQRQMVHDWMHRTYVQFTQRVMTTRAGKIQDIDKVARGRIFTANQALNLGMVDAIGGVEDAIAYAAKQADFDPGSYDVRVIPAPRTLADLFQTGDDSDDSDDSSRLPIQPRIDMTLATLLSAMPPDVRQLAMEQLDVMQLFQSHPIALVAPYLIGVR
ncbi:MAG TPA: signal peptide peptidase SppA [Tepidisphaeraceae bacterium]|nr:signal peptide peptidase SppA [Tepidisphaeraceae bacterium]